MTRIDAAQIRIELARGHWALGERDDAVVALERALDEAGEGETFLPVIESLASDAIELDDPTTASRLSDLLARARLLGAEAPAVPAPLATPTLAKLLADQGHPEKAREVEDEWLRRRGEEREVPTLTSLPSVAVPESVALRAATPEREAKIRRLKRWLAAIERRRQEGVQA